MTDQHSIQFCQEMLNQLLVRVNKPRLAHETRLSVSSLNRLLRGEVQEPNHVTFSRIARYYFATCYDQATGQPLH